MHRSLPVLTTALALTALPALAAPPDACKLITPAEVGAAVGASVVQGASVNGPTSSSCTWKSSGVTVIVSTKTISAYDTGKKALAPTPVSGVGDEAYQTGNTIGYTALSVKKGGNAMTVSIRGPKDVAAVQAAEKAVAKAAVARL
jgi:hypothetical protein